MDTDAEYSEFFKRLTFCQRWGGGVKAFNAMVNPCAGIELTSVTVPVLSADIITSNKTCYPAPSVPIDTKNRWLCVDCGHINHVDESPNRCGICRRYRND